MTRVFCIALVALICVSTAMAAVVQPSTKKEVAIVHFDKLKDKQAKWLDGTAKNITLKPVNGSPSQTSYFAMVNDLYEPRKITVRILGLTEPEYDLYIDGNLAGTKNKYQLEAGIPISFSSSDIPPALRDYYTRLKAKAAAGAKACPSSDAETSRCQAVMQAVADWVDSIERGDNLIRTTTIIIVPTGTSFSLPGGRYVFNKPPDFPKSAKHLGQAVQIIRGDVQKNTRNAVLRYDTLSYITTVDFDLTTSGAISPGAKVKIKAKLTNWTDRSVTGKIRLDVPKDWAVKALSPVNVKTPGYSKSAAALFEITVPKTVKPDAKINAVADLLIEDVRLMLNASPKKQG
ncbi:MAG: NEW3 domain-containing protein [Armatimonadota bacterium]